MLFEEAIKFLFWGIAILLILCIKSLFSHAGVLCI
jgi:hypothetical protein